MVNINFKFVRGLKIAFSHFISYPILYSWIWSQQRTYCYSTSCWVHSKQTCGSIISYDIIFSALEIKLMQRKYLNTTNTITTCKNGPCIVIKAKTRINLFHWKYITLNPGSYHSVCISWVYSVNSWKLISICWYCHTEWQVAKQWVIVISLNINGQWDFLTKSLWWTRISCLNPEL